MSIRVTGLHGVGAALPTPYRFGRVDFDAFEGLCHRLIERGIDTLVPCGTTGEAALLTMAEQRKLIERAVAASRGRVPVIAGAGSNNTATAVELAVSLPGLPRAEAEALVEKAHQVCPYSNATRGNVDVKLSVV